MARIRRAVRWLLAAVIAGALLMHAPGSAQANGADVDTVVVSGTATLLFVNPCTGVTGTVTVTFKEVQHQVARPTGTAMTLINITGDSVFVPDDPALSTVTAHFTSLRRDAGGENAVSGTILHSVGRTADGTKISIHFMTHQTENGLGVTVVDFEKGCD